MLAKVYSGTNIGLEGKIIEVEVDVANRGFPTFTIVGLPDKAIDEAKERVRSAIVNSGYQMPDSRITVNLAPADIQKIGSGFDLPIALGILAASGVIHQNLLQKAIFIGELSLEGKIKPVNGILPMLITAKNKGFYQIYLSQGNAKEASIIDEIKIYPLLKLTDLILHLNNQIKIKPIIGGLENLIFDKPNYDFDFSEIKGQNMAKRGLEIAAAGFHNVHLKGPPGVGKTMLCRAFPSILPELTKEEILEVTKIYSVAGLLTNSLMINRPFRSPHHTASKIGLIGGGTNLTPGEISLAHRGVLFLDEFPEFPRSMLEALRQPMEDGFVTISRASGTLVFPSRFILLAASNPCPCGYLGHPKKSCHCTPGMILKYKKRLSGPILDRIDLHIELSTIEDEKLLSQETLESSEKIRKRVINAHKRQKERFKNEKIKTNSEMRPNDIKKFCCLTKEAKELLKQAINRFYLSARAYFKIIKISQTIADLEGFEKIKPEFIAEALQYRIKEDF
jgi:magnesium chelatase family protein